jgi:GTP 3',8-cyclase
MKFITSDKVFGQLDRLSEWKETGWTSPVTIEVHPSNKCNNACHYCSMWQVKDAKQMSGVELTKSLKFAENLGAKGIIYSGGGEPLMNTNMEKALKTCKLDQGIITNGVLLRGSIQDTVLRNCKWVRISLDACNSEQYKRIRGTADMGKVTLHIKQMLALKKKIGSSTTIGLQIVVGKHNYRTITEFCNFCLEQFPDVDYVQVRPIEVRLKEEPYSKEQLSDIFWQLENELFRKDKVLISAKWDLFKGDREFGFKSCHAAPFIGVIDSYCDYYLCCHMVKQPEYKICNVMEGNTKSLKPFYSKFGKALGFNKVTCPVGCRGSSINRVLEGLKNKNEHRNFL